MYSAVKECIIRRTWSTDHGVTVEARQTEFTLRSCGVVSTRTVAALWVAVGRVVVVTETALTCRKRPAVRWIACVAVRALLAELTLQLCTS